MNIQAEVKPITYVRFVNEAEGELDGYLAVWGSFDQRDAYKTWFDPAKPPDLGLQGDTFLPVRLMMEHGMDDTAKKTIIGKIVQVWRDSVGIRFRAYLDKAGELFSQVVDDIRAQKLGVSSASAEHLADFDDEGRFVNWYLSEVSLTESPAEPRMPKVALVRSAPNSTQLVISNDKPAGTGGDPIDGTAVRVEDRGVTEGASAVQPKPTISARSNTTMKPATRAISLEMLGLDASATPDQIYQGIEALIGPEAAKIYWQTMAGGASTPADPAAEGDVPAMMSNDAGRSKPKPAPVKPEDPAIAALRAEIADLKKGQMTEPPPPQTPQVRTDTPRISLGEELKYAGKSHSDLEFAYLVMRSQRIQPSEEFMRNFSGKVAKAIEDGNKSLSNPAVRSALRGAIRSNEIAISTASGGGDEWVAIDYASQPWAVTRNETTLIDQLIAKGMMVKEVPQGTESTQIPTEGADPTVYTIAQSGSLTSSRPPVNVAVTRIGTGSKTLTPGELGAAVAWSDVFNEDSIVNVSTQYNFQTTTKLQETVVQLWINGDTDPSASTNINLIDGTPGTGTSTPYYIASNGALKYALVTGSSTSRDGGTLDENDYRLTLKLMTAPTRAKLSQLIYVIDPDTHSASLDIAAIKTEDVKRTNATITSGVLTNIYGIDVVQTGFMALANNAGKIPNAGGTLGRILCAFAPYWAMGWKRHITIETDRDILTGDNILVAKMRVGFVTRGADSATVTYNLTV